ncbi:hypothetical protein BDD12DRAFT_841444 [Trichophaea hybrida]|nr:hypothetical protein BDD12DRAFT_841444 [Trichophaea hybrida]
MDRLSASLDNVPQPPSKTPINADTSATTIDDEDDSEIDENDDKENLGMVSKHLVRLDLLALLLITEAKSDVAATMLITKGSMKFFYSKNKPFTDSENKYVRTLFNYASQTDRSAVDRYEGLMAAIVDKVKELQSTSDRGIHSESHLPSKCVPMDRFLRYAVASAQTMGLPSELNFMIDQKLLRRIHKLGNYLGAVIQLIGEIDRLPPRPSKP